MNKIGKNANNTNQKEDEPKDKRFRRKLIPITDAVKQPKPKKLSVEFAKPKVVPEGDLFQSKNLNLKKIHLCFIFKKQTLLHILMKIALIRFIFYKMIHLYHSKGRFLVLSLYYIYLLYFNF